MSRKIVTIGGGHISQKDTLAIDKEIIRLSGAKHPKVLFIPTASSDAQDYWEHIQHYFGEYLGCRTDVLWLIKEKPSPSEVATKILNADIVYVGGGNTLKMMKRWHFLGVDKVLKEAWEKGVVLCGISAGSICWYEYGHSDSLSFYDEQDWHYIKVKGLGFLRGINCPHFDSETLGVKRRKNFEDMIQQNGGFGIALDDCCALEFVDDQYRAIAANSHANAYTVYKRKGKVISQPIKKETEFSPLSELYRK